MGLTYKENVPDTRESPVREMVKELQEFGCDVYGYDPIFSQQLFSKRTFLAQVLSLERMCVDIRGIFSEEVVKKL